MIGRDKPANQPTPPPAGSADPLFQLSNGPSLPSVPAPGGPAGVLCTGASRTTGEEAPAELEAFQSPLEEEEEEDEEEQEEEQEEEEA